MMASPPGSRPASILVVEDDNVTRTSLVAALREEGYEVHVAVKLRDARATLEQKPADVLLLDGLLPDGDGIHFVRELRSHGFLGQVIFMSSFFRDMGSFKQLRSQELHVSSVMHKPLVLDDVLQRVREALAQP